MSTTATTLKTVVLKALIKCCEPKHSHRMAMRGVHIDGKHITASNGYTLVAIEYPIDLPAGCSGGAYDLRDAVKAFKPSAELTLSIDGTKEELVVSDGSVSVRVEQINAIYPAWRRVLPDDNDGLDPVTSFSPGLMAQVLAVLDLLPPATESNGYVRMRSRGDRAITLNTVGRAPAATALVMPVDD